MARDLHARSSPEHPDDAPLPFVEVFVDVPLEVAEKRDPKGLYAKARAGEIKEFTGISAPYERPEKAEIHIQSDQTSVESAVEMIFNYLQKERLLGLVKWEKSSKMDSFSINIRARLDRIEVAVSSTEQRQWITKFLNHIGKVIEWV